MTIYWVQGSKREPYGVHTKILCCHNPDAVKAFFEEEGFTSVTIVKLSAPRFMGKNLSC